MASIQVAPSTQDRQQTIAYTALVVSVMAGSVAAILVRLTQLAGVDSIAIVVVRLGLAALILTPLVLQRYRGEIQAMRRQDFLFAAGAGFWLGMHFICFVLALQYTSVLNSQAITNTGPIWVALLEVSFLKARLNRYIWIGLVISSLGGALIFLANNGSMVAGSNAMFGNILAIGAALTSAVYLVIGRKVRAKVSLVPYVWIVYSSGALTGLVALALSGGTLLGYSSEAYFWLFMVTLIPQLLGHSGSNFALGYLPATLVSLGFQIISVSAGLIAFLLFQEVPGLFEIVGSAVLIVGVTLAIIGQGQSARSRAKRKA